MFRSVTIIRELVLEPS